MISVQIVERDKKLNDLRWHTNRWKFRFFSFFGFI